MHHPLEHHAPPAREVRWQAPCARRSLRFAVAAGGLALAPACSPAEPEPAGSASRGSERAAASEEEDHDLGVLETLGYAGFAEDEQEPGASSGVLLRDAQRSWAGYDLVTSVGLCVADLLDPSGDLVHSWTLADADILTRATLLPDGDLLVVGAREVGAQRELDADEAGIKENSQSLLARLAWDGSERWRRVMRAHHDVELTPDGHILVLTESVRDIGVASLSNGIVDNALTLLDGDGNLIAERSVYDILSSAPDEFTLRLDRRCPETRACDFFHANSVEWMRQAHLFGQHPLYAAGHVLVSLRHQSLVFIADFETGELLWAWGPGQVSLQHEATLTAAGNVLLFDNGSTKRGYSRVVEVDPRTRALTWEYVAPTPEDFFSAARGTVQELPNGNVLVAESVDGEAFELTRAGEIVWHFATPRGLDEGHGRRATIRIERYPPERIEPLLER